MIENRPWPEDDNVTYNIPKPLPVYILIRTSNRPKFFKVMMDSIKSQTYKNIITIVHTDDPADDYVTGDIIIKSERLDKSHGSAPYNLYNNKLLKAIPDGPGYYHFIDDDDMYYDDTVIEKTVKKCRHECINVVKVQRWNDCIFPAKWKQQHSFQTECFMLHTDHKNLATWWASKGGDHNYSKQITSKLPTNWIDGIVICKAQEGKGHGRRYDLGAKPNFEKILAVSPSRPGRVCLELVTIQYQKDIRVPSCLRGKIGDIKQMQRRRAERLEAKGKVKILGVVNG